MQSIILALLLQAGQPAAALPREAIYLIDAAGEVPALLDEWSRRGVIRRRAGETADFSACAPRDGRGDVDIPCARRLLPTNAPSVAIIVRGEGRRNPTYAVICVGAAGVGRARLNGSREAFSGHVRTQNEARAGIAACISHALPGATRYSAEPLPAPRQIRLPYQQQFPIQDVAEARRAASDIAILSVDHVGHPRGVTGSCLVTGFSIRIEKGVLFRTDPRGGGTRVELSVPCAVPHTPAPRRRVDQLALQDGMFLRLYVRGTQLLDAEPVRTD